MLWNILKNSLIYIFVRYLSYSLLKIHRKLAIGFTLCDEASLSDDVEKYGFTIQSNLNLRTLLYAYFRFTYCLFLDVLP